MLVTKQYDQLHIRNVATCLDANYFKGLGANQARTGVLEPIAVLTPDRLEKRQNGRRFKEPGEPMFTLTAQDKHGVMINEPKGLYVQTSPDFMRQPLEGLSRCLKANKYDAGIIDSNYRIRKLTPLECFRLQSYPDWWYVKLKLFRNPELIELVDTSRDDITAQVIEILAAHKVKEGVSDSQLYKMAGNGVTSQVSFEIARRLSDDRSMPV